LYKLFNDPDITKHIKINRLSLTGHISIIREKNSRTDKKVFDTGPEGTREPVGPKLRWEDSVIQDIRQGPGSEELGNVIMNTEDWLKPLKRVCVHPGLLSR
jgi:hypothetical protein